MVTVRRRRLIFVCVLWVVPSKAKFLATSSIDRSDDIGHNYAVNGLIYTIRRHEWIAKTVLIRILFWIILIRPILTEILIVKVKTPTKPLPVQESVNLCFAIW